MIKRTWTPWIAVGIALCSLLAAVAHAQARPKIAPPDFKRETVLDVEGLRQWAPFEVTCTHCKGVKSQICEHCKETKLPICNECEGEKRATCRPCAGKGKLPDPLLELACPYCEGSTWYPCGLCNSFGSLTVEGLETKCGACKQKGLLKCGACSGKRRVDVVKVGKKGVGELGTKELKPLLEGLKATLAALEKYEPESNPSKSAKALAKVLEPVERDLKVVKDMQKMLDDVLKGVKSYGAGYAGFEAGMLQQFLVFKDRTVFLLQHQVRATEQALERAEFNESK